MSRNYNYHLTARDRDVIVRALGELVKRSAAETSPAWRAYHDDAKRIGGQLESARFRMGTR